MRRHLDRFMGLLRRYRTDRRLPPPVLALVRDGVRLRAIETVERSIARVRMMGGRPTGPSGRLGSRMLRTAGALGTPLADLRHDYAVEIVRRLQGNSIDVFAVDRRDDHLVFGLMLEDRGQALEAIVHGEVEHWYLEHDTGRSTKLLALSNASRSRSVRAARAWRLFRAVSWGDRALGLDQAVEFTFWEIGASGQREMIGTRGHERFDQRSEPTVEIVEGRRYPGRRAFPVGSDLEHDDSAIDIVYTWVDGDDPVWRAQFEHWSRSSGRSLSEGAFEEGRFHSRDELRYSLRSVWAFAGWARHIYIVTAGQRPPWLIDHERISIIDHAEILPADALPTFNSHAIESALHRISGLAEQFIYFNDDVFLGRSARPERFFTSNGLPLVFLSGARTPGFVDGTSLDVDRAAQRGSSLLAERFGRVAASKPYHTPFPLLRSVMEEIETEFAQIVDETAHSRFRSPTDLSIASSFAQHYALATQRGVAGRIRNAYVHVESGRLEWHLDRLRLGRFFDTFCINETEQTAEGATERERMITAFFEAYFPVSAPWESDRSNGRSSST